MPCKPFGPHELASVGSYLIDTAIRLTDNRLQRAKLLANLHFAAYRIRGVEALQKADIAASSANEVRNATASDAPSSFDSQESLLLSVDVKDHCISFPNANVRVSLHHSVGR